MCGQVTVTPRQSWFSRSKNFALELYAYVDKDAGVGLVYSESILHPDATAWQDYVVQIPAPGATGRSATVPCPNPPGTRGNVISIKSVHGAGFLRLEPGGSGSQGAVSVRASSLPLSCAEGGYLRKTSEGGATCEACPEAGLSFSGELQACVTGAAPSKMCSAVLVDKVAGDAHLVRLPSPWQGADQYASSSLTIQWDPGDARWLLRNASGTTLAYRGDASVGPFAWDESAGEGARAPAGSAAPGVRAVVVEQAANEILNLCELEMLVEGVNVAPTHASCFLLHAQEEGNSGYWYTADRSTGKDTYLNDGCSGGQDGCSCAHTGDSNQGNMAVCILSEALAVDTVHVHINPNWRSRSTNLHIKLYAHLPDDIVAQPSVATLQQAAPFFSQLNADMRDRASQTVHLCYAAVEEEEESPPPPTGAWPGCSQDAECLACAEAAVWRDLGPRERNDTFRTGGLGHLMVLDEREVWGCFFEHPCLASAATSAGAAARCSRDWMCFQYHEQLGEWQPWGRNSLLHLFDNPLC